MEYSQVNKIVQPKYKSSGWRNESARHSLASKGIKTGRKSNKKYDYEFGDLDRLEDSYAKNEPNKPIKSSPLVFIDNSPEEMKYLKTYQDSYGTDTKIIKDFQIALEAVYPDKYDIDEYISGIEDDIGLTLSKNETSRVEFVLKDTENNFKKLRKPVDELMTHFKNEDLLDDRREYGKGDLSGAYPELNYKQVDLLFESIQIESKK